MKRFEEFEPIENSEFSDSESLCELDKCIERNYHAFIDAGICLCKGNVLLEHYWQTNLNRIVKGTGIDGRTPEFNLYAKNIHVQIGIIYDILLGNNFMLPYSPFTVTNTQVHFTMPCRYKF
ncbi:hypothetical protein M9H77_02847 [Catharanthus roseus]|uniref:Uncharacterized protein n=1 Tax=Catharanthus roseus TaxID=4058 RepID=A0ACC0C9I3_CATRO|nr:hypothetical protein M9H77_02847 [Catharanthus roseus]